MNNSKDHQKLVDDILFAVGSMSNVRVWPRQVGVTSIEGRVIAYGLPGETDIQGIIAPQGKMLCLEVKTGKGRLTEPQERYRDMIVRFGGVWACCRSVKDAMDVVKSCR